MPASARAPEPALTPAAPAARPRQRARTFRAHLPCPWAKEKAAFCGARAGRRSLSGPRGFVRSMQRASGRSQACSASPSLLRMLPHSCYLSRRLANPRVAAPMKTSEGLRNGALDHARVRRAGLNHACGASDVLRDDRKGASCREHPSPFAASPHNRLRPIEWADSGVEQVAAPSSPPQHATVYSPVSLLFVCAGNVPANQETLRTALLLGA